MILSRTETEVLMVQVFQSADEEEVGKYICYRFFMEMKTKYLKFPGIRIIPDLTSSEI